MTGGMNWISVKHKLPKCSLDHDSFGTEVLVWPRISYPGSSPYVTAFYGCRIRREPCFYKYGMVVHGITHWMPLPDGPNKTERGK